MSHSTTTNNITEERALALLGAGNCTPSQVAQACGVSEGRITQLLSDEIFAAKVAQARFENLQKYTELDDKYDALEAKLVKQLEDILPLIQRPMELVKSISVINAAKRRGAGATTEATTKSQIVNLVMPSVIVQKFTTNINNQVIQAGSQTLETIQSSALLANKAKSVLALGGTQNGNTNSEVNTGTITDSKEN